MKVCLFRLLLVLAFFPCAVAHAAASCKTSECHASIGATQYMHEPVKEEDCSGCHKQTNPAHPLKGGKSFVMTEKGAALCYQCHEAYTKKKNTHPPVKEGECAYCHNPHGGAGRYLLESDDQTKLCLGCHDAAPFTRKYRHGPVAVGVCTKCHDPHQSNEKALLRGAVWETCTKCHVDFLNSLKDAPFIHTPVRSGPCTSCHDPHSAQTDKLVKKKTPDICMECHKGMQKKLKAKIVHKPLVLEGGCTSCHSVHFSKFKGLLAGDGLTVCLGCHGSDKLGSPPLRNIKKEIEGKKFLHGPIALNQCQPCHDPHGNDNYRLLKGNYPDSLYAPYTDKTYELCLTCHDKNLLRFPETTIYTKFRNGKRNLHYVHVVNARKGRTCRICHQAHASDGEKLINKESVQFGEWKIPINFKSTPAGGRCAPGCHQPFTYDREKAAVYGGYSGGGSPPPR